jgi:hypothetical protein
MNPADLRLERLLEAAQRACPSVSEPSPWFEQRLISALRAETAPSSGIFDGLIVFRLLSGAALLMTASLILSFVQIKNPYLETLEWINPTSQIERIP